MIRQDKNLEKERRGGAFFLTHLVVTVDFERGQIPAFKRLCKLIRKDRLGFKMLAF